MGRMIDDLLHRPWNCLIEQEPASSLLHRLRTRHDDLLSILRRAVPIVADEVAAFIFAQEAPLTFREWDWSADFPNCAPPFPEFFVEWTRPDLVLLARPWGKLAIEAWPRRMGLLFVARTPERTRSECPVPGLAGQDVDYAHCLTFNLFMSYSEDEHQPYELGVTAGILIDRLGRVVGTPAWLDVSGIPERDERNGLPFLFAGSVGIGLLTLTFMHCRAGVRINDTEPPERLNRARVRRGRPPLVRHKTLVIDGVKQLLRREGGLAHNGLKRALHLVRGHFVTYSPEKPLFGHFTGTVFRTAHTRGRRSRGEVVKDYEVKAPEAETKPDQYEPEPDR